MATDTTQHGIQRVYELGVGDGDGDGDGQPLN